ncbi:MAG: hypothetical protein NTY77_20415 [Elusimicrobia bacterium]|nr:hypothetical protein [Elusimicrobiota bacterium]
MTGGDARGRWLLAAGLFLAALAVRALPYSRVFHDGRVFLFANDSWCELRRTEFAMRNGLALPEPDPYLAFPEGGRGHWGPLLAKGAALSAMVLGVDARDRASLERYCAWLAAVLGALCVLAALGLGWSLLGAEGAVWCAAILAVLPGHVNYTMLGNFDQHVLESLLFGLASLLVLALLRAGDGSCRPGIPPAASPRSAGLLAPAGSPPGRHPSLLLAAGAALWLLTLVTPGLTPVYAGILWLVCAVHVVLGGAALWPVFALPAVLLLASAGSSLGAEGEVQRMAAVPRWLMFEQYSFFQPLLMAFFAAALKLAEQMRAAKSGGAGAAEGASMGLPSAAKLCALALVSGALAALLAWPVCAGAARVLFKGQPWLKYISEYQPLFFPGLEGGFRPKYAFQSCTYLLAVFPVLWAWVCWRKKDAFLWVWPSVLYLLAMVQLRYIYVFSYAMALVLAAAWLKAKAEFPKFRAAALLVLALAFIPSGRWLWSLSQASPYRYLSLTDDEYTAMEALGRETPPTSGYLEAGQKPEYGVLAPWSLGHALVYLARRPVVADPFGHGVEQEAAFYSARTADEALAVLRKNRVRYVLGQDVSGEGIRQVYSDYLGLPPDHPLRQGRMEELFQMRRLAGLPGPGLKGKPDWRFTPVYRSPEGQSVWFEFTDARSAPLGKAAAAAEPSVPLPAASKPASLPAAKPAHPAPPPARGERPAPSGTALPSAPSPPPVAAAKPAFAPPAKEPAKPAAPVAAAKPAPPAPPPAPPTEAGVIARIGEKGLITEQDLTDFTATENCYGPDALSSRKAGLMRSLESDIMEDVLRREARVELSAEDYSREVQRVDEGTRAPDILACIKKHFGWDPGSGWPGDAGRRRYERIFLRKSLVPPPFHKFVTFDRKVQGEAYRKRDAILARARQGAAFADLAKEFQVEYATRTYSLTEPKEASSSGSPGGPPGSRWSPFEAQFITDNLKGLAPGAMKPEPMDVGEITFVKLLEVAGDKYRFETLRISKKTIPDYLNGIPKLRCVVYDPGLKSWLQSIHGNPMLGACSVE